MVSESLFDIQSLPPKLFDGRGEKWSGWIDQFLMNGWVRKPLPTGDFCFQAADKKTVGIEVKSVPDFIFRLDDARRELANLCDQVDYPIFLVWGKWSRTDTDELLLSRRKTITWGHSWNFILTFQCKRGLIVEPVLSREHTYTRINQLYVYFQDPEHNADMSPRRTSGDRRVASLLPIRGISSKLSKALLDRFGSLHNVSSASIEELMQVPLIGAGKAALVYDHFHREKPVG